MFFILGTIILIYVFSCMCLCCFWGICLLCSQVVPTWTASMLMKHLNLAECSGLILEEGGGQVCKSWSYGWHAEEVSLQRMGLLGNSWAIPRQPEASHPLPCSWDGHFTHHSQSQRSIFKDTALRNQHVAEVIWTCKMEPIKASL